jgi:hypothetical protein
MHAMPTWNLDATSILTRRELAAVLADLNVRRSLNARRNLVACCQLAVLCSHTEVFSLTL